MTVTMSHPDLPGVQRTVTLTSWEQIWQHRGWVLDPPRQVQDPARRIVHDWNRDGWAPWTNVLATADGDQQFSESVETGRGRVTGTVELGGNRRDWYLRDGTMWESGRVTVPLWGPSTWGTIRPQAGLVLAAQQIDETEWVGYVVWINIVGASPPSAAGMLVNGWHIDGTTLLQGTGGAAGGQGQVDRSGRIMRASHITFGQQIVDLTMATPHQAALASGAEVTIAGMANSAFNVVGTVNSGNPVTGNLQLVISEDLEGAVDATAGGTATPVNPWRSLPKMVSAERSGNRIRVKQWPMHAPEPDWSDPHHVASVEVTAGNMPVEPDDGPGLCGLMAGHMRDGEWFEFGNPIFETTGA